MKLLKLIPATLIALMSLASLAQSQGLVEDHVAKVLFQRANEVLNSRIAGLRECKSNKAVGALTEDHYYRTTKYKSEQERLTATFKMIKRADVPECSDEIAKSEKSLKRSQRKMLNIPFMTAKAMCVGLLEYQNDCKNILRELDPFCATQNGPDLFGTTDPNPCMAGDRLLAKVLRKPHDPNQEAMNLFLSALEERVQSSRPKDVIDLWNVYLEFENDTPANRKNFIANVTFFYYALGTAGGYVDGIADSYWMQSLTENNPSNVFPEYLSLRRKADWYRNIIRGKSAKNRKFTITGIDIKDMNRHDFMSMFLSCHYKKYGKVIQVLLPNFLGLGYESLDFVSHIKTHVSLSRSIDNFNTDTKRYRKGTSWGASFCSTN